MEFRKWHFASSYDTDEVHFVSHFIASSLNMFTIIIVLCPFDGRRWFEISLEFVILFIPFFSSHSNNNASNDLQEHFYDRRDVASISSFKCEPRKNVDKLK